VAAVTPSLSSFKRIVIKIGSALLVDRASGTLKRDWLETLVDDLASLATAGADIVVVSSGAIAMGRTVLALPSGALKLEESQAAASVGQIALARLWSEVLGAHGLAAGQILVTLADTEERRRFLNARNTIETLLAFHAVPVVNENDTVATDEIKVGDNDRLAARVATMVSADCLVLLSDIDGLYTAPPQKDPNATLIPLVPLITAEIEAMAGGAASELSRGGMTTKIEAGKIATTAGTTMVIASGKRLHPLRSVLEGGPCTWFLSSGEPVASRKRWIAGQLDTRGTLFVDAGAVKALKNGKSLLPAGVIRIEGEFESGDTVVIRAPDGGEIGRGFIAFSAHDTASMIGKSSTLIEAELGYSGRTELIHRDDMALRGG
jgi:glutamate 5-kinase